MKRFVFLVWGVLAGIQAAPTLAGVQTRGTPSPTPFPRSSYRAQAEPFVPGALPGNNCEFKGIPAGEFYRRLSRDLAPYLGGIRKKPSKSEKIGQAVGCAVGIGCAAVAAGQALGVVGGNDPKNPGKGNGKKQGKAQSSEGNS